MNNNISVKQAILLIKNNKFNNTYVVDFNNEPVEALDVMLLAKNGITVPEDLIYYDDDNIDFSDIPEITDEDIETKKIIPVVIAEIAIDNEIQEWMRKEKINLNQFSAKLIKNFYDNLKSLSKKTAL